MPPSGAAHRAIDLSHSNYTGLLTGCIFLLVSVFFSLWIVP